MRWRSKAEIRHVLRAVADNVRSKHRRLTVVHGTHGRRFEPDLSLLEDLSPYDRMRNQLQQGSLVHTDMRFSDPLPVEDGEPDKDHALPPANAAQLLRMSVPRPPTRCSRTTSIGGISSTPQP
jgi:hypothetical protein